MKMGPIFLYSTGKMKLKILVRGKKIASVKLSEWLMARLSKYSLFKNVLS